MDQNKDDCDVPSVDESAFWHTNMDLYYGFVPGEVVEVEHEPNKYWLASILYCYKHLVLLEWVGEYGSEFWLDTSSTQSHISLSSSGASHEAKRLFPLGHHLQTQLKSQFILEKPSKVLEKPSLYEPSKDPYANIRTVDDLLVHELDRQNNDDAFAIKSTTNTASLVLAKCKTKISYGQEDQDELEAALQSLTGLEESFDPPLDEAPSAETPNDAAQLEQYQQNKNSDHNLTNLNINVNGVQSNESDQNSSSNISTSDKTTAVDASKCAEDIISNPPAPQPSVTTTLHNSDRAVSTETDSKQAIDELEYDNNQLRLCKEIQAKAVKEGRYYGVQTTTNEPCDQVYFSKPKQFFDVGGANQERLFVKGTLLEVCHSMEKANGDLELCHWFASVLRNIGGRLTLRWYLCEEPKFKQGRLETKSIERCSFVAAEALDPNDAPVSADDKVEATKNNSLIFSLHFCDPRISSISASPQARHYKLPASVSTLFPEDSNPELLDRIEKAHVEHIFDTRRLNLDKDRPLIDHLLEVVRFQTPKYLDLIFAPKDKSSSREVLMTCPKMTKVMKARIVRDLGGGAYEIHSEPISETAEVIKFIYPYDSAYTILPLEWAINNEDCLSVNPSRTVSPSGTFETNHETNGTENSGRNPESTKLNGDSGDIMEQNKVTDEVCLKDCRFLLSRRGSFFKDPKVNKEAAKLININSESLDFDHSDPSVWQQLLADKQENAERFHCCIDYRFKESFEAKFKVMDHLEVVHPSSYKTICLGRIRKVVFPLIWVQLSTDCYTLVTYNLTDIYPLGWCEANNQKIVDLLPPRKRCAPTASQHQTDSSNKRRNKRAKVAPGESQAKNATSTKEPISADTNNVRYEKEYLDLGTLDDRQVDIDYILNEKSTYIKIFFNHKCFTGPSLSKSKICSLPQYVGPGPMRLVVEEVVTKVISVAYVPPRILNDLSSKLFEELLIERNLTNTIPVEFKAKYQKRVHRDKIPVCVSVDDVALYCECICEHIKCCYNLFGLNLFDGDDCPSHCRSLTKSNKFMKRATYYREKARQGEFLSQGGGGNNNDNGGANNNNNNRKQAAVEFSVGSDNNSTPEVTTRPTYTGRNSSESTASSSYQSNVDMVLSPDSPQSFDYQELDLWSVEDVVRYLRKCDVGFKNFVKEEGIDGKALLLLDRTTMEECGQEYMKLLRQHPQLDNIINLDELNRFIRVVENLKAQYEAFCRASETTR